MSNSLRADFRYQYEAELDQLSRKRFYIWVVTGIVFWLLVLIFNIVKLFLIWYFWSGNRSGTTLFNDILGIDPILVSIKSIINCAIMIFGMMYAQRRILGHDQVLRITLWMLVAIGVNVSVINGIRLSLSSNSAGDFYLVTAALPLVTGHFCACAILPWNQKHAVLPAFALWLTWLVGIVLVPGNDGGIITIFVTALIVIIMFLPGIIICALRTTVLGQNFEKRMLEQSYIAYSRELFDARKIHEALFPKPALEGNIQYVYHDRPRTGIGGDLLHAHFDTDTDTKNENIPDITTDAHDQNKSRHNHKALNLVTVDVGGDGIPAALTVNRLHGEIERIYAEHPDITPDKMITLLNRYACYTLAPIGIYAVAMCVRVEANGNVQWAGAGHIPVLIKQVADNSIVHLESTTWPLGASKTDSPDHRMQNTQINKGDILILYTDGACQYKTANGARLGYTGVIDIINSLNTSHFNRLPESFFRKLDEHIHNENLEIVQEDVLFVAAKIA